MEHLRDKLHGRRLVRIVFTELERQIKRPAFPWRVVGSGHLFVRAKKEREK